MRRVIAVLTVLGLVLSACANDGTGDTGTPASPGEDAEVTEVSPTSKAAAKFTVNSSAFADGEPIPAEFSCKGRNVPPPLEWAGVPEDTGSLALVVDDPDAVGGLYVHWVVTDIPPSTSEMAGKPPAGATVSANSGGKAEYLGPCPPAGTGVHHYRFQLYALPEPLGLTAATPHKEATAKIRDAAIGEARLVGTYRG